MACRYTSVRSQRFEPQQTHTTRLLAGTSESSARRTETSVENVVSDDTQESYEDVEG